jgi:Transposase DDE domain
MRTSENAVNTKFAHVPFPDVELIKRRPRVGSVGALADRADTPSAADRGKRGVKRSMAVDAKGVPLGAVSAPANRHDSPLLVPTIEATSEALGTPPEGASVHLDRGYDSELTRQRLEELGLGWEISGKGKPTPYWATYRWVVGRTSSRHNIHKKLVWCTERVGRVIDLWVAFSSVVIIGRRLIREGWVRYRWEGRPSRQP